MSGAQEYTPREFRSLWPEFDADSWAPWASVEDAMFGIEPEDTELVRRITGRERVPTDPVKEFWAIVGRGGGKSRFCARLAVYFACGRAYRRVPGERIFIGIFAPDRKQAGVMFRYVLGLLCAVPALERMVRRSLRESVELDNGVTIEVITASKAAPRGRSYALAIVEEAAFLPADDATDPDKELLRALRPALARVPGSVLAVVSSPYARRGELWRTWKERYGKDDSDSVLVVQADTLTLNPDFDEREIERAYAEDPVAASAEYGAQFRTNVSGFISREAVEGCTVPGRRELPPVQGVSYTGFVDFAGGSGQGLRYVGDRAPRVPRRAQHGRPRLGARGPAAVLSGAGVSRLRRRSEALPGHPRDSRSLRCRLRDRGDETAGDRPQGGRQGEVRSVP